MPEYTAGRARILLEPTARGFYTKARTAIRESVGSKGLDAPVRLKPVADGFHTEATKKVQATAEIGKRVTLQPILSPTFRSSARDQVNAATANLHLQVQLRAEVDFTKANSQILAWRRRQEAVPLRIQVMPQQGGITGVTQGAGSRNWRARNIPGAGVPGGGAGGSSMMVAPQVNGPALQRAILNAVKQGVQAANQSPATKVSPKVSLNTSQLARDQRRMVADLQRQFEDNFRLRIQPTIAGVQLRLPLGSLGTQVIPGAVAAIGSLIASLQQLAQAGLALPGAISVAGASLGTFAIGIGGISDAWKALSAEEERTANQSTSDAARMQSAYNSVRNASVDVTRAQKDLNDARKDARRTLEDLHNEERSNNLSVAEAALNLRKARNELAKPSAGALDRDEKLIAEARARESLNDALTRQKRNREDVTEADKKGLSGADAVTNAQENLTRALQAQTEAMTALKNESSAAANAADKTKAAFEKLGPEVSSVVQAVWDSRDAWLDFRKVVSGNMFRGFDTEVKALTDASLPLLTRRIGGIATVWNETLHTLSGNLRSAGTQSILDRILGNTAETQGRFNRAIDPIIRGLGTLAAAGSDMMPRFANAIGDVATRFANFIEAADDDGRLQQWIEDGMDAFATLGRVIANVGSSISGITRAFGGSFLTNMEKLTKRLSDFLNSGQGQQDLQKFIHNVREDFEAWRPIIEDLPAIFGAAMEAARQAIQSVLPLLNLFTEVLEHAPGLIGAVVTAFLGWNVIRPLMSGVQVAMMGVSSMVTQVGTNFAATKAKAADAAASIDTAFAVAGKSGSGPAKAASAIGRVGTTLGALAGPFGAIAVVVAALIPLIKGHDDAAEAAQRQADAIKSITLALDDVTKAAGAKALFDVSNAMQDFKPTDDRAMSGNVQAAVEQLGFNPTDFAASTLVGGEQARAGFAGTLRDKVRPVVQQALQGGPGQILKARGMTEDDVINAFLGDPAAKKKFEDTAKAARESKVRGEAQAFGNFNLGDIRSAVEAAGGQVAAAGLAGQFLSQFSGNIATAQGTAQTAQRTATGVQPTLSATGKTFFSGANVTDVSFNGSEYGLNVSNIDPSKIANLEARNNRVKKFPGPNGQDIYTITFTDADAKNLLSYEAGGPTPKTKGDGPTGGHIVEVHDEEWVLPKHARRMLGDDVLWSLTGKKGVPRRNGFDLGGPGGLAPLPLTPPVLPPIPEPTPPPIGLPVSGVGTGPAPGPVVDSTVPAPTDVHGAGITPPDVLAGLPADIAGGDPAALLAPPAQQDAGNQFLNAWFPWLGAVQGAAGAAGGVGGGGIDPLAYLGQAGGNFLSSLGSTLLSGVMGFFGLDLSTYMGALQQTVGFYSNKFGPMIAGAAGTGDQYVDPVTGQIVSGSLDAYNSYGYDTAIPGGYDTSALTGTGLASSAIVGKPNEGSGVIAAPTAADQATIDASRAPNASVISDANILNYMRSQAEEYGLSLGDERYRTWESDSLHTVGMAGDISGGTPEQRRAFVEAINADPLLKNATRMLIDDLNPDMQLYAGATNGSVYTPGKHADHLHWGLEGVPGYSDPSTGAIMQRNVGSGGDTLVTATNQKPKANPWGLGRSGSGSSSGLGSTFGGGGGGSAGSGGFSSGIPPLDLGQGTGPTGASPNSPTAPFRPPSPMRPGIQDKLPFLVPGLPNGRTANGPFGIPALGGGGRGANTALAAANQRRGGGRVTPGIAPPANYSGGNQQTWDKVYAAFTEAGFPPGEWGALVNLLNGESGWRPTVANPSSGAFGLFQFLGSTQKAYLPDKNPDPYIQGRAGMKYIKDRYGSPAAAWQFWQNQSPHWYDNRGMLPRGASMVVNQTGDEEVVLHRKDAQRAKKIIEQAKQMDPRGGTSPGGIPVPPTTKKPGPPLAPDVDIPRALPAPGISAPTMNEPAAQKVGQAPSSNSYVHPALAKGISSGAATLGSLASTAISAAAAGGTMGASAAAGGMGAGQAGQLVSGLFQQGGKVVTGIANVVSAAITGITKSGTTENPYGVTLRNNQAPPPLAQDNRRVHNGDNNFASMDEWRQQTQIRDAQDMQAQMTRMRV